MSENKLGPGTYLTEAEAKEVQKLFIASTAFFVFVAIVAHFLVWEWRPWLGAPRPYAQIEQPVQQADATHATPARG